MFSSSLKKFKEENTSVIFKTGFKIGLCINPFSKQNETSRPNSVRLPFSIFSVLFQQKLIYCVNYYYDINHSNFLPSVDIPYCKVFLLKLELLSAIAYSTQNIINKKSLVSSRQLSVLELPVLILCHEKSTVQRPSFKKQINKKVKVKVWQYALEGLRQIVKQIVSQVRKMDWK